MLQQGQVAGAGNGQELGDTLNYPEKKGLKGMHAGKLPEMLKNATGKWEGRNFSVVRFRYQVAFNEKKIFFIAAGVSLRQHRLEAGATKN